MAMFVHLAPEKRAENIRRNGIRRLRHARGPTHPAGLFAVPVTPNFFISHQWLRELLTAAAAVGEFRASSDKQGWQVIVPRAIEPKEIHRIKAVPQIVGWRYKPGVHGTKPCGCDFCARGRYGARKLRERYKSLFPDG